MEITAKSTFASKLIVTIFAVSLLLLFLFPIYWIVVISLRFNVDIFTFPPNIIFTPTFDAYRNVMARSDFVGAFFNSLIVAVSTTLLCLIVGLTAGYSVVTFDFRGKRLLQILIVMLRMAPAISMVIPLYMIFASLRLVNTRASVIMSLVAFLLPFTVWLLLGYLRDVPKDLIHSALIDGCGYLGILAKIVVPLTTPGIAAVGILVFILSWNEFLISSVMVSAANQTLPVLIRAFLSEATTIWNEVAAVGVIISIPTVLVTLFCQKYIVGGLTMGAIKG